MSMPGSGLTFHTVVHPVVALTSALVNFIIQKMNQYDEGDILLLERFQHLWREAYKSQGNFAYEVAILQYAAKSFEDESCRKLSQQQAQYIIDELTESLEEESSAQISANQMHAGVNDEKVAERYCPALLEFIDDKDKPRGPKLAYTKEAIDTLNRKFGLGYIAGQLKAASCLLEQYYIKRLERMTGTDKGSKNDPVSQLCMALIFKLTELSNDGSLTDITSARHNPLIVFFHLLNSIFAERNVTKDAGWFIKYLHDPQDKKDFDQVIADVRTHVIKACLSQEIEKVSQGASKRLTQLKNSLETLGDDLFDLISLVFSKDEIQRGTIRQTILGGTKSDESITWLSERLVELAKCGTQQSGGAHKEFLIFEFDPKAKLTGMMLQLADAKGIELFNQLALLFQQILQLQHSVARALQSANRGSDLAMFGDASNAANLQKIAKLLTLRGTTETLLLKTEGVLYSFTQQTRDLTVTASLLHKQLADNSEKGNYPGWTANHQRYLMKYESAQTPLVGCKKVVKKLRHSLEVWSKHPGQKLDEAQLDAESLKRDVSLLPEEVLLTAASARAYNEARRAGLPSPPRISPTQLDSGLELSHGDEKTPDSSTTDSRGVLSPSRTVSFSHNQDPLRTRNQENDEKLKAEEKSIANIFEVKDDESTPKVVLVEGAVAVVRGNIFEGYNPTDDELHKVPTKYLSDTPQQDKVRALTMSMSSFKPSTATTINPLRLIVQDLQVLQSILASKQDGLFTVRRESKQRRAITRAIRLALIEKQVELLEAFAKTDTAKKDPQTKIIIKQVAKQIDNQKYFFASEDGERDIFNKKLEVLKQRVKALLKKPVSIAVPVSIKPIGAVLGTTTASVFNSIGASPAAPPPDESHEQKVEAISYRTVVVAGLEFICPPSAAEMPQEREERAQALINYLKLLKQDPQKIERLSLARTYNLASKDENYKKQHSKELKQINADDAKYLYEQVDRPLRNRANELGYIPEEQNPVDVYLQELWLELSSTKAPITIGIHQFSKMHLHFLIHIAGGQTLREQWDNTPVPAESPHNPKSPERLVATRYGAPRLGANTN